MIENIAIKQLDLSPLNVRKTNASKQEDAELLASIKAHGLLENLIVVPSKKSGRFEVIAGGRRLQQLQKLTASGDMKKTDSVPCHVREIAEAEELSLIENTHRAAMHPADEFEAFQALILAGTQTETSIAARFGVTKKHVKQRLRLAKIHPEIIAAFKADKLSYDAVIAFTAAESQDEQLQLWREMVENNEIKHADGDTIRHALKETALLPSNKLVTFVGLKAYRAAGGTITSDLFSDIVWVNDSDLIKKLAAEKLQKTASNLEQNDGWAWAEITTGSQWPTINACHQLEPQIPQALKDKQAALDAALSATTDPEEETRLEAEIEENEQAIEQQQTFKPEEMAIAGCIVYVNYHGALEIYSGLVRPKDQPALLALHKDTAGEQQPNEIPPTPEEGTSQKHTQELIAARQKIAREHLAQQPALAINLLMYSVCKQVLSNSYPEKSIHITCSIFGEKTNTEQDTNWAQAEDNKTSYDAFNALPQHQKESITAYAIAQLLSVSAANAQHKNSVTEAVLADMEIAWHKHWQPTPENYFGKIKKEKIISIGESIFGAEWREEHQQENRATLASSLYEQINEQPDLKQWLPAEIA